MDKLLNNKWFVRVMSFLIAVLLYAVVTSDGPQSPVGSRGGTSNGGEEEILTLVPYYDDSQYILSGLPDTVTVQLDGSNTALKKASLTNGHEAFIDLSEKEAGTYTVPIQTKGFPGGLTITTFPSEVKVTLFEKKTETFPVKINLVNENKIADGYQLEKPIISPNEVKVTSSKDLIDRIAFVEGFVDVQGAKDTVEETVLLHVYDQKGNVLDVKTDPGSVQVKVPITEQSKTVPVRVRPVGILPDGLMIESIELKKDEVTLFGPQKTLDDIGEVEISLDISDIEQDQTVELEITPPDGVNKITPEKIEATVKVVEVTTKTLKDIPIVVNHLPDGWDVSFLEPVDSQVDVKIQGTEKSLENIKKSDIIAYVDVKDLSEGTYTVTIEINKNNAEDIQAEPEMAEAEIEITEGQ